MSHRSRHIVVLGTGSMKNVIDLFIILVLNVRGNTVENKLIIISKNVDFRRVEVKNLSQ